MCSDKDRVLSLGGGAGGFLLWRAEPEHLEIINFKTRSERDKLVYSLGLKKVVVNTAHRFYYYTLSV